MKNIHVLPTDKPSRLYLFEERLILGDLVTVVFKNSGAVNQNIYITSDEVNRGGDWFIKPKYSLGIKIGYCTSKADSSYFEGYGYDWTDCKKIILTTDQDLIKDDVQAIDDTFLQWFVKNPSCEEVKVDSKLIVRQVKPLLQHQGTKPIVVPHKIEYKLIIPKEEQKQHLIDIMKKDEELGLYDIFNDEKRQGVKELIDKHKQELKQLFTDYPITELGDEEFKEAPIRQCELLSYDNNKYCYVKVEGIEKEIKRCYIYPQKGRCGKVDCISNDEIKELLKEEPKQDDENYLDSFGVTKTQFEVYRNFNKQKTLEGLADKWVFKTNGHKWSNNNNEAGDNFGSFIAGFKEAEKTLYSEEDLFKILLDFVAFPHEYMEPRGSLIERYLKELKKK